jgi:hypothetical protein
MKWIVRGLIVLIGLALIVVVGASWYFWSLGADAIARGKAAGWVAETESAPLTVFEQTVVKAEFAETWNRSAFPCRTIARGFSPGRGALVSDAVIRTIQNDVLPERTFESALARASATCQLEWAHNDTALLRQWLKHARITKHGTLEDTSQALLGKPTTALDEGEAARLVALLSAPGYWRQPEKWTERAEYVLAKVREYAWAGDMLERRDAGIR